MRRPTNWNDLAVTLAELFNFKDYYTGKSIDFNRRRIRNASPSELDYDYVVRKELHDLVGGGLSQPPVIPRGVAGAVLTYDKITFGIGVGGSVSVGSDLTPPYIWSNSDNGRPLFIAAAANIPPVGDDLDFDIKRNGSSIFTLGKFTIPDGTGSKIVISSTTAFVNTTFSRGNVISIDVSKIGTTTPGQMITAVVFCKLI